MKKIFANKFFIAVSFLIIAAIIAFVIYWINYLKIAHSSFENYYEFRECVQLIEKTDTYGTCKIQSGATIKIVKYNNKWYLDGDLPGPGLNFL